MIPTLSILCPSFRASFLDRAFLQQVNLPRFINQVEFILYRDNDWSSILEKQRKLVEMSRGTYLMFVADDDIISPSLLPTVLDLLDNKIDGVSFDIRMIASNGEEKICQVNPHLFHDSWDEVQRWENDTQFRPWHPIMPTHARLYIGFNWRNLSYGEDNVLIQQMSPRVCVSRLWKYIPKALYTAFPPGKKHAEWKPRYGERT